MQSRVELWDDDVSVLKQRLGGHHRYPPNLAVEVAGKRASRNSLETFTFFGVKFIDTKKQ